VRANEIALNILLVGLTIVFVFATATIPSYVTYAEGAVSVVILVALFVTLIPTTIGALLSAIGIAGMDRLVRFNVLAMSGRAVDSSRTHHRHSFRSSRPGHRTGDRERL
jgi:K+-transporting ATPase ATPase B chain